MIKLNNSQREAYDIFLKEKIVIIDAPRKSGKTEFLKYIIEKNPNKSIGVFSKYGYPLIKSLYGQYKNCKYNDIDAQILIGDETIITGFHTGNHMIACVMTRTPKIIRW
jgi:hypothetical protein